MILVLYISFQFGDGDGVTYAHGMGSLGHIEAKWGHGDIREDMTAVWIHTITVGMGGHGNKTTCRQWTAAEAEAATSTGDNIPRHKRTTVTCSSDPRPLKGHVIGTFCPLGVSN